MTKFRAILADTLDLSAFNGPIKAGMKTTQGRIAADYNSTISTWDHRPGFDKRLSMTNTRARTSVTTNDPIYGYVHDGTRPHIIRPRRARALAFQSGYRAKTTPGSIKARGGGPTGTAVIRPFARHPGFAGRNFTPVIADNQEPLFAKEMQDRFEEGAAKSGHSI